MQKVVIYHACSSLKYILNKTLCQSLLYHSFIYATYGIIGSGVGTFSTIELEKVLTSTLCLFAVLPQIYLHVCGQTRSHGYPFQITYPLFKNFTKILVYSKTLFMMSQQETSTHPQPITLPLLLFDNRLLPLTRRSQFEYKYIYGLAWSYFLIPVFKKG